MEHCQDHEENSIVKTQKPPRIILSHTNKWCIEKKNEYNEYIKKQNL